jgi:hypothetical protein
MKQDIVIYMSSLFYGNKKFNLIDKEVVNFRNKIASWPLWQFLWLAQVCLNVEMGKEH